MNLIEVLKIVWPLILVQFALQVYALYDLFKRKTTKNLTPLLWGLIIVLGEIFGAALYFLIGKSEE